MTAQAGLGLASLYRREKSELQNVLRPLAQTDAVPGDAVLDGLTGGAGFRVTRRVIEAIREEPRPVDVADRLAGELAIGRVMEQAAMARPGAPGRHARAERRQQRSGAQSRRNARSPNSTARSARWRWNCASRRSSPPTARWPCCGGGHPQAHPVWEASPDGGLREGAPE